MRTLTVFLTAVCCLTPGYSELICNLGDPLDFEIIVQNRQEKRQDSSHDTMPDGKPVMRFHWDSSRAKHFEFTIREPVYLPRFDKAVVKVGIYVPENCEARNLKLRLRDNQGEHLEYRMPLDTRTAGWQTIPFSLDSDVAPDVGTWPGSKNANKRIDFPMSLVGFASEFPADTGPGWLGFGDVRFENISAPPDITLETGAGSAIHVIIPGEEKNAALRVSNQRPDKRELLFEYKINDSQGQVLSKNAHRFALAPNASKRIALPPPKMFGVYAIDAQVREFTDGSNSAPPPPPPPSHTKRLSYSYMQPSGPTSGRGKGFLFGLSVHTQHYPRIVQEREALAAAWCGAKIYREDIYWRHVQPRRDAWTWNRYDSLMSVYDKYDMEMQGIYVYVPNWAHQSFLTDRVLDDWGTFVREVARHYRGRIRYMEVWNEPDIQSTFRNDPAFYVDVLKRTYAEVKQAVPEMTILSGGVSGTVSNERQTNFVRHLLSQAKGFYDVIAFHGHGPLNGYMPHMNALLDMRKEFDISAPWYPNETAAPTNWVGHFGQGPTLFKKLLVSWANGAIGYTWYDLRNDGFDPKNVEHNYGLLTHDFFPKPAYGVYNMLAGYFREAEFLRALDPDSAAKAFLFRSRDNGFLLPAWSNDSSDRLLHLTGITGKAVSVDLFGNETPLPVLDGSLAWSIGANPATLRIIGQDTEPVMAGEFIGGDGAFNVVPGAEQIIRLGLRNPTRQALTFSLAYTLPKGLSGNELERRILLQPGLRDEIAIPLRVADGFRSLPGRPSTILLKADLRKSDGSLLWTGTVPREIRTTVSIPNNGFSSAPTFDLRDASQVTRLVPSAPANEPYYWKGPQDLSACIWLARDRSDLRVKVVVTDDVHVQPHRGSGVFNGDNVQMALQLPGQSGLWEIGLTLRDDGGSETFVWLAPDGFDAAKTASAITLVASRNEAAKTTTYEAAIPFSAIGLSMDTGQRGFRFNLLVNDNDGPVRESYICIAPSITDPKSPQRYPTLSFR
ncbi:sugar-binding protein [Geminisphaera colitermitum]|uniref:sugar-binding protein n=1 Tax=Geminisphaera colitermitum TaxID=1148786 RepID=UPI000158D3E2|nr:sugar-binding protein [Geminisphaera colitermitum]